MKITKFGKTFKLKQWNGEKLKKYIGIDTETELIQFKGHVPRLVLTTVYDGTGICYIITNKKLVDFFEVNKTNTFIYHNAPFDLKVINKATGLEFYDHIESDRILDTMILLQLVAIATRGYIHKKKSLDYAVSVLLKDTLPKDDNIRLTFGQFIKDDGSIDYKAITKGHYIYACLDPIATFLVFEKLEATIKTLPTNTRLGHMIHFMGHMALYDINQRGIGVDLDYVKKLDKELTDEMNKELEVLATYGWVRGQEGIQNAYNMIIEFLELDLPKNSKGYSMKAEDLEPYKENPFIKSLLNYLELEKRKSFLNELNAERVHPYYDPIKNTGRTSCSHPNIQNPPRMGGIREAFVPKEGHIFIDADYSSIEMFTAAYHMKRAGFGDTMFTVLNEGLDPHIHAAKGITGKNDDEITKDERQQAKPANYGFLANMSPATFINYAKGYGLDLDLKASKKIKDGWIKSFPEVQGFWKSYYKSGRLYKSPTGFMRADCAYTEWLNNHFQGPAAEGVKIAMYFCMKAGLNMVAFVHDQIVIEEKIEEKEEKKELLEKIMVEGMQKICPMNIDVEAEFKERYSK